MLRTLLNSPDTWPPKKEALRAKGPSAVRRCSLQLQTPLYCHTGADPSYCCIRCRSQGAYIHNTTCTLADIPAPDEWRPER
eukprot:scaffold40690_cov70-Phaeocystis_antarctica.AAC.1